MRVKYMKTRELSMVCDICGVPLNMSNIGYIRNPIVPSIKPIQRCRECHRRLKMEAKLKEIKENKNKPKKSKLWIEI